MLSISMWPEIQRERMKSNMKYMKMERRVRKLKRLLWDLRSDFGEFAVTVFAFGVAIFILSLGWMAMAGILQFLKARVG